MKELISLSNLAKIYQLVVRVQFFVKRYTFVKLISIMKTFERYFHTYLDAFVSLLVMEIF